MNLHASNYSAPPKYMKQKKLMEMKREKDF
jgi:hypothetical protein